MSVKVREQRGKLYLDVYHGGVRKWESLHIALSDDKRRNKELYRLAEACRSKREAQLLAGEGDIRAEGAGREPLAAVIRAHKKIHSNPGVLEALARHVEKFSNGAAVQIGQVTPKWVADFQASLCATPKPNGDPISQSSVGSYMKLLRAVFRKAAAEGVVAKDPTATVALAKVTDPEMVFLSAEEVKAMAACVPKSALGKEARRAFLFGCCTGLRISDLRTLAWGMIERDPPQIIKRQKKTKSSVFVPLNKSAAALLFDGAGHSPDELVFSLGTESESGKLYRALKGWAADAGITKKIGWHTARRTFGTMALGRGADAVTVAKLLGHSGLDQVMKYAKATDEMKRRAVESLPELD